MATPIQSGLPRLRSPRHSLPLLVLALPLVSGCDESLPTSMGLAPPPVTIKATLYGQPPTSADRLGIVYGSCVDAVAEGLLLACGDQLNRRGGVAVCSETRLRPEQARLLVDHATDIFLPRLESLEPDVARVLAGSRGILSLTALESLSPAAAAELAVPRDALVLSGLTSISAEAAAGLARHQGPLKLDGLRLLEPGVATGLANHQGHLCLNGLEQLSASDAAALAQHRGDLCLNGLPTLAAGAAEALAAHRHGLHLNRLRQVSTPVAAGLARHRGWCLGLNGLVADQVSADALDLLGKHRRVCLAQAAIRRPLVY